MGDRSDGGLPDPDQVAELRPRAAAGDRNAAGRLGELLARQGDLEGAVQVWARAYGDDSPTTRRLGELLAERGDLEGAVRAWQSSDVVWQNPAGLHAQFLSTLGTDERLEYDDPEDWAFTESQELARLLAGRDDGQPRYVASWADHEPFGSDLMDLSTRPPAAQAGYDQGRARAEQLTGFWRSRSREE